MPRIQSYGKTEHRTSVLKPQPMTYSFQVNGTADAEVMLLWLIFYAIILGVILLELPKKFRAKWFHRNHVAYNLIKCRGIGVDNIKNRHVRT